MLSEEMLADIKARLDKMTIHEVRQTARVVKAHVTSGQKGTIVEAILSIAQGEVDFAPVSKRGAPPKSDKYDEKLVADILSCREYFLALRNGGTENLTMSVNDSVKDFYAVSDKEYCGYLDSDGRNYFLHAEELVFVSDLFITRFSLRIGDEICCKGRKKNAADYVGAYEILTVNGASVENLPERKNFADLTHLYPDKRICLTDGGDVQLRMVDLFAPLAYGQRAVISAPANSGKTTLIKAIAHGICSKYRNFEVIVLTVGARPEEITEFSKSKDNITYFYTSFDKSEEEHLACANLAFEYAKRRAELNGNAIILADGLYENIPTEYIKNYLCCAVNAEEGGSLTVVAALPPEFNYAGVANTVICLSPVMAAERIFPAIDILKSYSGREEVLLSGEERRLSVALRARLLHGATNAETVNLFKETATNTELAEIIDNG